LCSSGAFREATLLTRAIAIIENSKTLEKIFAGLSKPRWLIRHCGSRRPCCSRRSNVRKIAAGLFISLDGVVEFPERWGFQYIDKDITEAIVAGIAQADAVLLGPATYRLFTGLWSHQTDDVPMAKFLNRSLKYVVSKTPDKLGKLDWEPAIPLKGELASALAKVKAESGKTIQVPGSPRLVRSLLHQGLLDELSLIICPEVVGSGMRLFDEHGDHVTLRVGKSMISSNGAISVTYRPLRSDDQAAGQPLHFAAAVGRK
jgi:dihydrofolate reductase